MSGKGTETPYERKLRMLRQLKNTCYACTMCELGRADAVRGEIVRDPHVFSSMTPYRIMLLGQNPGWDELKHGTPFVGASGKNFDAELEKNGLDRNVFYISNAVRCFTPGNAAPTQNHLDRCRPFLMMEVGIIKPWFMITLGASAFSAVCPDLKFGMCLGQFVTSSLYGVKVFPIYHPSPRNLSDPSRKSRFSKHISMISKIIKIKMEEDKNIQ